MNIGNTHAVESIATPAWDAPERNMERAELILVKQSSLDTWLDQMQERSETVAARSRAGRTTRNNLCHSDRHA